MSTMLATAVDAALGPIVEKVHAGERLSFEDGLALYRTRDIFTLGSLANQVRERLHGRRTYYNINRHINYSNFCVLRCKFCSFYRTYSPRGAQPEGSYAYTLEQVVQMAGEAYDAGATEVHIVGGLHPTLPFEFYTDMCRAIKARCPRMHIKAFTAIEIVHFTRITKPRLTIAEVLTALRAAGLGSLPGGGAEIFDDRVHAEAFRNKVGEQHWFDVHRTAHDLGIPSNATMLYGHIETVAERIAHMVKLREHQDEALARRAAWLAERGGLLQQNGRASQAQRDVATTLPQPLPGREGSHGGAARATSRAALASSVAAPASSDASVCSASAGPATAEAVAPAAFNCFIPLSFIPDGSELAHLPGPTGLDDLRTLAVSRLMVDNIAHLKAFWIMQSPKLAQVALDWGVDDFDGTVVWYDITKREGQGTNHQELGVDQMRRLIREAGCVPVERDTLYRPVVRGASGEWVVQG